MRYQLQVARVAVVLALLVVLAATGCARRVPGSPAGGTEGGAALTAPAATGVPTAPRATEASAGTVEQSTQPSTTEPNVEPAPTQPPTSAPATPAPFKAPDLTAIQRLLDELEAALSADATADTEEGSAP